MKSHKYWSGLLAAVMLVALLLSACAPAATPAPTAVPPTIAPTAAPKPTEAPKPTVAPTVAPKPVDFKAVLDKYVAGLPDGFSGVAPANLAKEVQDGKKSFLVDVREPKELTDNGYLEGAVNIPIRTLAQNLDKLPAKDLPIVVYCAIGHRGAMALETLQLLGYTNVRSISGGFNAWKAANLPVATGTPAAPTAGKAPDVDKDLLAALDKYLSSLPDGFNGYAPATLAKDIQDGKKSFLLDVREPKELTDNGYLDGAVNIPIRTLTQNLAKLPAKDQPIVVYCAVGHRGGLAMMALHLLGYTNVRSISGGFNAWKAGNFPIVKPALDVKPVLDKYITNLPDGFSGVAPAALAKEIQDGKKSFLLDVREPKELTDNGFIEGAVNLPIRTLTQNLDKLPAKDQAIVVYCAIGHRGAMALETLQLLGYTNVRSISGGFNAWKAANLAVATGTPTAPTAGKALEVDKDLFAVLDKYITSLPDGFSGVAPANLAKEIQDGKKSFLLDVREPKELTDNGYLEGAVNIPIRTLTQNLSKLPAKDQPIVVYCAIGHRGGIALETLQLLGYTNVRSISGGFNAWKAGNFPIVKP